MNNILPHAFALAQNIISEHVRAKKHRITDYDTTLTVALYNGEQIYYGQSGDGGIVGLTAEGDYVGITNPQKGDDGICVIPLRAGAEHWQFGTSRHRFAAVLAATDGVYDTFFPYLLQGKIYVPLVRFFLDKSTPKEKVNEFLTSEAVSAITDDKTVAVAINPKVEVQLKPDLYYAEPDWAALKKKWFKRAYPHLADQADAVIKGES